MGCVCIYMQKVELWYWWEHGDKKNKNKLVEWKVFLDVVGIKSANLKISFCSRVLQLSELPRCKERFQTAMCCLEWLQRLMCLAAGLDVSWLSLSTLQRCFRNWAPTIVLSLFHQCISFCNKCKLYVQVHVTGSDTTIHK